MTIKVNNPNCIAVPDPDSAVVKHREAFLQFLRSNADKPAFSGDEIRAALDLRQWHLTDDEIAAICTDAGISFTQ